MCLNFIFHISERNSSRVKDNHLLLIGIADKEESRPLQ